MARPKSAECESCGTTFAIAAKGRIPARCPDCRGGKNVAPDSALALEREGPGEDADLAEKAAHREVGEAQGLSPASTPAPASLDIELPNVPDREDEPPAFLDRDVGTEHDPPKPEPDPVVWTGDNLDEVRKSLDKGICFDWDRANGRPFAEVHGELRDWFITVKPGDTVWHDGVTSTG